MEFLVFFVACFVVIQVIGFLTYKYEVSWLCTDYLSIGLAATTIFFYGQKAEQDDARQQLPNYVSHLSQMRQMAESNVQHNINTLDIMHQYGPADGLTGSSEYRSDIMELTQRIQAFTGNLQAPDWPELLEQFFDCDQLSAGLASETTKLVANDMCDSFKRVRTSRNEKNEIAKKSESGFLAAVEIHIYPLFFALGLAIRLGRITADVRRKWPGKKTSPAAVEPDVEVEVDANKPDGDEPAPDAIP